MMAIIEQNQVFELAKDLNPVIVKGMMGLIVEIQEPDKTFVAEFPKEDGSNYEYNGINSFTIATDYILIESLQ
jgi:ATP-dependent exoDNAse (exonuclease V) alpha subunit